MAPPGVEGAVEAAAPAGVAQHQILGAPVQWVFPVAAEAAAPAGIVPWA